MIEYLYGKGVQLTELGNIAVYEPIKRIKTRRIIQCPETVRMALKRHSYVSRKPKEVPAVKPLTKQRTTVLSTFSRR